MNESLREEPHVTSSPACACGPGIQIQPFVETPSACDCSSDDQTCCGPSAGSPSGRHEKPGYAIQDFVERFAETVAGTAPMVKTQWEPADVLGAIRARIGVRRNEYRIAPGLYGVGAPNPDAPVFVSANYKLSFDHLRRVLSGQHAWILVLDTRGINVWCAAGKGTFGTDELVERIRLTGLAQVVRHRRVILPQLGAAGVSAHKVRKRSGFEVVWGPIRAADIPLFLKNDMHAAPAMRAVTFSFRERLILVPVEIGLLLRKGVLFLLAAFVLSGIGPRIFSFGQAWDRGLAMNAAILCGVLAGACIVPLLLPWIPGAVFAGKGAIAAVPAGLVLLTGMEFQTGMLDSAGLLLVLGAISSYLAMNFTGSTPYTSPSGVEKEMRMAMPLQAAAAILGLIFWIASPFI